MFHLFLRFCLTTFNQKKNLLFNPKCPPLYISAVCYCRCVRVGAVVLLMGSSSNRVTFTLTPNSVSPYVGAALVLTVAHKVRMY